MPDRLKPRYVNRPVRAHCHACGGRISGPAGRVKGLGPVCAACVTPSRPPAEARPR